MGKRIIYRKSAILVMSPRSLAKLLIFSKTIKRDIYEGKANSDKGNFVLWQIGRIAVAFFMVFIVFNIW